MFTVLVLRVCGIQLIGSSDDIRSASLECSADDVDQSPVTLLLLCVTPTDITSTDLFDDIHLQLCMPHACKKVIDICIHVTILDFVRSALTDPI